VQTKLSQNKIKVLFNEEELKFDVDPYIKDGRTLVPFRWILEALGAEVSWNPNERSVLAKSNNTNIYLKIGKTVTYVNGNKVIIDVPAEIKDGRTFVPLRFVAENLGAIVTWDGKARTVSIKYKNPYYILGDTFDNGEIKISVDKLDFVSKDKKLYIYGKFALNGKRIFISVIDIKGYSRPAFFESVGNEVDMRSFKAYLDTQSPNYVAKEILITFITKDGKEEQLVKINL
jgi:hypothetical protein